MRLTIARGLAHFSYTPLLGLAAGISFVKLIVYAQLIGVTEFGALGKMLLVSAVFGMASSLGLQSVASRELPALIARGRVRRGFRLLAQTLAVTTLVAVLCLLSAAAGVPLFDLTVEELALGVLHGWAQQAFLVAAFESRSRLDLMRYARDMAARNLAIALAGVIAGIVGFGARGVVLAEIIGTLVFFAFIAHSAVHRAHLRWPWLAQAMTLRAMRLPWRAALVLFAGAGVMFASFNLDRWIAAEVLPRDAFGAYAFAWMLLVAAQSVQGLLNSGLLPLLSRRRAERLEASAYRLTWLVSAALLGGGLLLMAPAVWALGWVIERWMPQYSAAVPLLLPLLLAAVLRVADFWSSLLVVVEREGVVLLGQSASCALAGAGYLAWLFASSAGPTPLSLAWLAVFAALLSTGVSLVSVLIVRPRVASAQPIS